MPAGSGAHQGDGHGDVVVLVAERRDAPAGLHRVLDPPDAVERTRATETVPRPASDALRAGAASDETEGDPAHLRDVAVDAEPGRAPRVGLVGDLDPDDGRSLRTRAHGVTSAAYSSRTGS